MDGHRLETSYLNNIARIHVHIVYIVRCGRLLGHCSLQAASEVKSDLRFEISDFNYQSDPRFKVTLFVKK